MKRLARRFLFLSAILWTVTLLSAVAQPAWAEISGNCEATFKGVDVRPLSSSSAGDAIDVNPGEVAAVVFTSPDGFTSHKIDVELAGVSREASSGTDDGDTQWSGSVNVDDYSWGKGLYKVIGTSTLSNGSTCSGAALVNITGDPLSTVAGIAAAATTAVGGAGLLASSGASVMQGARTARKAEDWIMDQVAKAPTMEQRPEQASRPETPFEAEHRAWGSIWDLFFGPFLGPCFFFVLPGLLLTAAAMAVPGGSASQPTGLHLRRVPWRPRISAVSLVGGLLAGAGIVVLLQQYAVAPLTRSLAIEGLVIGLVVGLVLPSLVHAWSVMKVNGAIARGERRLIEALGPAGTPPGGGQAPPPQAGGPQAPPEGGPQPPQAGGPQTPPQGGPQTPPEEPQG